MVTTLLALRPVQQIGLGCTVGEAARRMYMGSATALAIVDGSGMRLLGVITERDIVATVAEGLNPQEVTIADRLQSPRGAWRGQSDAWFS